MQIYDPLGDRQSHPRTRHSPWMLYTVKPVENVRQLVCCNATATIPYLDAGATLYKAGTHVNRRLRLRVLDGIIKKVYQDLCHKHKIHRHQGQIVGYGNNHATIAQSVAHLSQSSPNDILHITRIVTQLHCAGFEASHIEQVAHYAVETLSFLMCALDESTAGGLVQVDLVVE